MNINRRKLFGFFATASVAAVAALRAEASATAIPPQALAGPIKLSPTNIPVGYIADFAHYFEDNAGVAYNSQGVHGPGATIVRRKIYDGEKFVDLDGNEGAAVMNRILTAHIAHR